MGKARDTDRIFSNEQELKNDILNGLINASTNSQHGQFGLEVPPLKKLKKFFPCSGGVLDGPIGDNASIVTIASGKADISIASGKLSRYVILKAESGTTDTLDNIPAVYQGQDLYAQAFTGHTITISDAGNIDPDGKTNLTLTAGRLIYLKWDYINSKWRILASSMLFPAEPKLTDEGNTTGAKTINLATGDGHVYKMTLTGNVTLSFSNYPSNGFQREWELEIHQDGTGGRTITWPAEVVTTPAIATGAGLKTILTLRTNDAGTTVDVIPALRGSVSLGNTGFATTSLNNLASVAINDDLLFASDGTIAIGELTKRATNVYSASFGFDADQKIDMTATNILIDAGDASGNILFNAGAAQKLSISTTLTSFSQNTEITSGTFTVSTGTATFNANTVIGNAATDTCTVNADISSNLIPDANTTRDLGSDDGVTPARWGSAFVTVLRFDQSTQFIRADGTGMRFELPTADRFDFEINNVIAFQIEANGDVDVNDNNINNVTDLRFSDSASIQSTASALTIDVPTGDIVQFSLNSVNTINITNTGALDINGALVFGASGFELGSSARAILENGSNVDYNVGTGGVHNFEVNNVDIMDVGGSSVDLFKFLDLQGGSGAGSYIQFTEETVDPSAPAANGGILYCKDSGAGKTELYVRFNSGATQLIASEP